MDWQMFYTDKCLASCNSHQVFHKGIESRKRLISLHQMAWNFSSNGSQNYEKGLSIKFQLRKLSKRWCIVGIMFYLTKYFFIKWDLAACGPVSFSSTECFIWCTLTFCWKQLHHSAGNQKMSKVCEVQGSQKIKRYSHSFYSI